MADSLITPRRRHRVWPWVLGIFLVLLVALAAAGAAAVALGSQALDVRDDLQAAKSQLAAVPELVKAGDSANFDAMSAEVLARTSHADEVVQGPLWSFASAVPFVGQNIAAVREVTEATHLLVRDALPGSFAVLSSLRPEMIRFEGGGFNLEVLHGVLDALPPVDAAFSAAQQKIDGIDRGALLPIVDEAVGQVLDLIGQTAPLVHTATEALPTALDMLGDSGPRTYFIVFQNNAEIRATGGNPAAGVLIQVDAGRVSLVGQTGSATFATSALAGKQYIDLPADTLALYASDFTQYSQNYTRTPNFPTTSALFQGILAATGQSIDGVISLDPVALSHMMAVSGPVTVGDVQLTSDNVVSVLLNETYFRFPGDQAPADAFFAAASGAVFNQLVTSSWDPLLMMDALKRSVAEQRVYGWFTRESEEAIAHELGIDGTMTTDNSQSTQVGIFLNDSGVSKLEYYLSTAVTVDCDAAARTVTTTLSMTNSVDRDDLTYAISSLRSPRYGAPQTSMLLDVLFFAPPGATITGVTPAGDVPALGRTSTEGGRAAQSITVILDKGETRTVSYTSTLPEGDLGPISVRYAPTVKDTPVTIAPACEALTAKAAG